MAAEERARNRRVLTSAQQPELDQLSSAPSSDDESDGEFARRAGARKGRAGGKGKTDAAGRSEKGNNKERDNANAAAAKSKTGNVPGAPSSGSSRPGASEWSAPRMSAEELASHYEQCIKLSATNKINAKNAFSLHLIEFMSELLRKNVNFQVASSTLHAGAKIYASRVDAVHKNTMRVRSGLSGNPQDEASSSSSEDEEMANENDGDQNGVAPKRVKPKKKKKKVVLASTEAQRLRQKRVESHLQVDPLFRLHAAEFNEGGVEALFANRYDFTDTQPFVCFSADTDAIVMHSAQSWKAAVQKNRRCLRDAVTDVPPVDAEDDSHPCPHPFQIPAAAFAESLRSAVSDDSTHICPHFRSLEFGSRDSQLDFLDRLLQRDTDREKERGVATEAPNDFDWMHDDADRYRAAPNANDSDDAMHDAGYTSPGYDDDDERASQLVGMAAEHLENARGENVAQLVATMIREGNTTHLSRILADKPSDFSFFDASMLRLWAGPSHWKMRNPFSKLPAQADADAGRERPADCAATKKKDAGGSKNRRIDFFAEPSSLSAAFKKSRATTLSEAALGKQERASTTLPEYAHYEPRMLTCAFLKTSHRFDRASHDAVDDTLVPDKAAGARNDHDDQVPGGDLSLGGDDDAFDAYNGSMIESGPNNWLLVDGADDDGNQNVLREVELDRILESQPPQSQANAAVGGNDLNQTLVAAPQRVAKMDINYTRVARHVDVPCVKKALWFLIRRNAKARAPQSSSGGQTSSAADESQIEPAATTRSKQGEPNNNKQLMLSCSFSDLLAQLPGCVTSKVSESLNSPIIFVCLLHLTNEKSLYLRKQENLADFDILLEGDADLGAANDQSRVRSPRARTMTPHAAARHGHGASNAIDAALMPAPAAGPNPHPVAAGRVARAASKHARGALAIVSAEEQSSETESPEKAKKKRVLAQ